MVVLIGVGSGGIEIHPGSSPPGSGGPVAERRFPDTVEIPPCAR